MGQNSTKNVEGAKNGSQPPKVALSKIFVVNRKNPMLTPLPAAELHVISVISNPARHEDTR